MKKFLFFIFAIILTVSLVSVSAFAEETVVNEIVETQNSAQSDATDSEENIFSELYGVVARHADKIFSALAFLGSLIIAFAYRKGLLPVIKGALSAMSAATSKLKEEAKTAANSATEATNLAVT